MGRRDSMQPPPKKKEPPPPPKEPEKPKSLPRRVTSAILDVLDQTWLQTLQYIIFLFAFQSLTGTIRKSDEFYFDKYLSDTFVNNPFDADHNRLLDVRRISDIWEWHRTVLTPGLFSHSVSGEVWADGDGIHSDLGATPLSTSDIVNMHNYVSFSQGIIFKQVRSAQHPSHAFARAPGKPMLRAPLVPCPLWLAACVRGDGRATRQPSQDRDAEHVSPLPLADARGAHEWSRLLRKSLVLW